MNILLRSLILSLALVTAAFALQEHRIISFGSLDAGESQTVYTNTSGKTVYFTGGQVMNNGNVATSTGTVRFVTINSTKTNEIGLLTIGTAHGSNVVYNALICFNDLFVVECLYGSEFGANGKLLFILDAPTP